MNLKILIKKIKIFTALLAFPLCVLSQEIDSLKTDVPPAADSLKSLKMYQDTLESRFIEYDSLTVASLYNLNVDYLSDMVFFDPRVYRFTAGIKNSPSLLSAYGLPERFMDIKLNGIDFKQFFNNKGLYDLVPLNAVEKIFNKHESIYSLDLKLRQLEGDVPLTNVVYGIGTEDTSTVDITFAREFRGGWRFFGSGSTRNFPYSNDETDVFGLYNEFKVYTTLNKIFLNRINLNFEMLQYRTHGSIFSDMYDFGSERIYDMRSDEGVFLYKLNFSNLKAGSSSPDYGYSVYFLDNKTSYWVYKSPGGVNIQEKTVGNSIYYNLNKETWSIKSGLSFEQVKNSFEFNADKDDYKINNIKGKLSFKKRYNKHSLLIAFSGTKNKMFGLEKSFSFREYYNFRKGIGFYAGFKYKDLKNYLDLLNVSNDFFNSNENLKNESASVFSMGMDIIYNNGLKLNLELFNVKWKDPISIYEDNTIEPDDGEFGFFCRNLGDIKYSGVSLILQKYIFKNLDASLFYSGYFNKKSDNIFAPKNSIFLMARLRDIEDIIYKYPLKSEIIFTMDLHRDAGSIINLPFINRFSMFEDFKFDIGCVSPSHSPIRIKLKEIALKGRRERA